MEVSKKQNWEQFQSIIKSNRIKYLYHFTDMKNLKSIKELGGLYSWSYCENNNIFIPLPGGNELSRILDLRKGLENYVRLSFVEKHPMLFTATNDGRINNPIIIRVKPEVIFFEHTIYSNMNAADNYSYIGNNIEILNSINFTLFNQNYYDLPFPQNKYYQAEVLVLERIPFEYLIDYLFFK